MQPLYLDLLNPVGCLGFFILLVSRLTFIGWKAGGLFSFCLAKDLINTIIPGKAGFPPTKPL